jgi:predicted DNA-binding protein (MmcQ/YjbR family)
MDRQRIRSMCLDLPRASEEVKWEKDLCFMVEGRMFCTLLLEDEFRVSLKVPAETFAELCDGEDIVPAPYLGRYNWIQVRRADRFRPAQWEELIQGSHALITAGLPASARRKLEGL